MAVTRHNQTEYICQLICVHLAVKKTKMRDNLTNRGQNTKQETSMSAKSKMCNYSAAFCVRIIIQVIALEKNIIFLKAFAWKFIWLLTF